MWITSWIIRYIVYNKIHYYSVNSCVLFLIPFIMVRCILHIISWDAWWSINNVKHVLKQLYGFIIWFISIQVVTAWTRVVDRDYFLYTLDISVLQMSFNLTAFQNYPYIIHYTYCFADLYNMLLYYVTAFLDGSIVYLQTDCMCTL